MPEMNESSDEHFLMEGVNLSLEGDFSIDTF